MGIAPEDIKACESAIKHVNSLLEMTESFAKVHGLTQIVRAESLGSGTVVFGVDLTSRTGHSAFAVVAAYGYIADASGSAGNLRQVTDMDDKMEPAEYGDIVPFDMHDPDAMIEVLTHIDTQFHGDEDECPAGGGA